MFWPDEAVLSQQSWWTEPAWDDGPGYGQLVEALRPALRAALLLGWQFDSIEVGTGRATDQSTEWASIELSTLELEPAKPLDVDKPFSGPNVHLGAIEVHRPARPDQQGKPGDPRRNVRDPDRHPGLRQRRPVRRRDRPGRDRRRRGVLRERRTRRRTPRSPRRWLSPSRP